MVGREVLESLERKRMPPGRVVLALEEVEADGDKGVPALRGVSLEVRSGEIVGIAAVAGNGQSELAEVITGLRACRGRVRVGGEDIANRPVRKAIQHGVAHVPEDRTGVGTAPNLSLVDNLIMKRYRASPIGRGLDDRHGRRTDRRERAQGELRDLGAVGRDAGEAALGRQHPAPDPRPRDRVRAAPDDRRAAHPRPRRGRGGVGPPAAPGASGRRRRDPPHLRGPGRDPRPLGPCRRAVRGPGRGHHGRGGRRHRPDRAADDGRRGRGGRAGGGAPAGGAPAGGTGEAGGSREADAPAAADAGETRA